MYTCIDQATVVQTLKSIYLVFLMMPRYTWCVPSTKTSFFSSYRFFCQGIPYKILFPHFSARLTTINCTTNSKCKQNKSANTLYDLFRIKVASLFYNVENVLYMPSFILIPALCFNAVERRSCLPLVCITFIPSQNVFTTFKACNGS